MKIVKLLFVVIAALVVTSVTYSNHSLDDSQKVADLSSEITSLEKENVILRSQIADAGSLTKIASKVEEMGFVPAEVVVSIDAPLNVASR